MTAAIEVKILADSPDTLRVGGYGVVWGGRDLVGDSFSPDTDLWLDKLSPTPPVLFDHGQDDSLKRTVVGRVESMHKDDVGLWIEAKITAHRKYLDAIRHLVKEGVLGWSSGAVGHLVERTPRKQLISWAIAEFSLTSTPMEARTLGVRALKSLAASDPLLLPVALEAESLAGGISVPDLPDSAFVFVESGGMKDDGGLTFPRSKRHLPHHDEEGNVDPDLLAASLEEVKSAGDEVGMAHLMRHAKALADGTHDDAHTSEWAEGSAAAKGLVLSERLRVWSERVAAEQASMRQIDMDTKSGARIRPELRVTGDEIESDLHRTLDWAKTVDRGVDGRARVDRLRQELALMDLEV